MYLHAESIEGKDLLPGDGVENNFDERLVAFLRLGNDIDEMIQNAEKYKEGCIDSHNKQSISFRLTISSQTLF